MILFCELAGTINEIGVKDSKSKRLKYFPSLFLFPSFRACASRCLIIHLLLHIYVLTLHARRKKDTAHSLNMQTSFIRIWIRTML